MAKDSERLEDWVRAQTGFLQQFLEHWRGLADADREPAPQSLPHEDWAELFEGFVQELSEEPTGKKEPSVTLDFPSAARRFTHY